MKMILFFFMLQSAINLQEMQANYEILEWSKANDLKLAKNTQFLMTISYNLGQVYKLQDLSYVVIPINPFGKALLTKDKKVLDRWITDSYFPTNEDINSFFFKNAEKIKKLPEFKDELIRELEIGINSTESISRTSEEIDQIYKQLKNRKIFPKYRLNFIVLVGEYLIKRHPDIRAAWALYRNKQLLNPDTQLALVRVLNNQNCYFKLENFITGKWGYRGMEDIEDSYKRRWSAPSEIETVEKLSEINYE
ncbi:hypothetical protein [Pedobacter sp. FW305-3-2-15-E-R2A2]|uniref:hypothetical protein n=1 Tax=Pedobacter sp. FW305-3-2-15-E-R2A2 TaxID=3140251 RepID=UPI0031401601